MTPALRAACREALHAITPDGRVLRGGRAVLAVMASLRWPLVARLLALPPFIWVIDVGYRQIAHHRPFVSRLLCRRG